MQSIGGGPGFPLPLRLSQAGRALSSSSALGAAPRAEVQGSDLSLASSEGDAWKTGAEDDGISTGPRIPLSIADRLSLNSEKKQIAQAYFEVGRELARRVTGDSDGFRYKSTPGLTNLDDSASLFALQARHGDGATTARSVPVTIAAMAMGALSNVPIEGARIENGQVTEARSTGHSLNPVLNIASAVVAGVALTLAPPLAAFALAGPLLTATPLVAQRLGKTNAPVHEMAHAMQYLLLGDLVNRGMLDASDLIAVQNDADKAGYLWGGETEKAAHAAETTGDIGPLFDVIESRMAERLEERHGLASQPVTEAARQVLEEHRTWMSEALSKRLNLPR